MIIINNGFNKFHLAPGASELARREVLSAFATGAYPTARVRRWLNVLGLADNRKFARLLARAEPIPDRLVYADPISESLHVAASWLRRGRFTRAAGEWANEQSLKWYGQRAQQSVRHAIKGGARLYHYRAGFGHGSVRLAKRHGLFALCDHSIAHPAMLEQLIAENGRWPAQAQRAMPAAGIWRDIQRDIEQADAVLVNSDFVKETFLGQGWEPGRVHVIYLGVDDAFLDGASRSQSPPADHGSTLRIVFAGGFELRKGARVLAAAMDELLADKALDFELHMAGGIVQDAQEELAALRQRGKVYHHGMLSRQELASLLHSADCFVFPSLAEGSARVIFEALACGCYVITTPNSGSIVEDGTHGRLIPAGEPMALVTAVREAHALGRQVLKEVGARNARIVGEQYRQSQYGDKLVALYSELLGAPVASAPRASMAQAGATVPFPAPNARSVERAGLPTEANFR
jgi:glycosyltransferase involved in cell wall biosynthesis